MTVSRYRVPVKVFAIRIPAHREQEIKALIIKWCESDEAGYRADVAKEWCMHSENGTVIHTVNGKVTPIDFGVAVPSKES